MSIDFEDAAIKIVVFNRTSVVAEQTRKHISPTSPKSKVHMCGYRDPGSRLNELGMHVLGIQKSKDYTHRSSCFRGPIRTKPTSGDP